uniref:Choline transporter-like protein n=1 Tax=Canis lupus familiaris TaxID=9615 RepID=A0A8I3PRX1_CANLF
GFSHLPGLRRPRLGSPPRASLSAPGGWGDGRRPPGLSSVAGGAAGWEGVKPGMGGAGAGSCRPARPPAPPSAGPSVPRPPLRTPQKYDPTFKGPIYHRGCTDIICCVFLLLAIVGYVAVGIIAWTHGDPRKVIYPTDSRGEFCGQKGTKNANKPFLFYFNIVKCASPLVLLEFQCPTPQICVEKCPDRYLTYLNAQKSQDFEYYKQFCVPGFQNNKGVAEVLRDGDCPAVLIPSKPLARRCFPAIHAHKGVLMVGNETTYEDGHGFRKNITELVEGAKKANGVLEARQLAMRIFEDYTVSWYWIVLGLVIAMLMSLLFIVLLRFLAGIMVWVMIIMVILVLGYGTCQFAGKTCNPETFASSNESRLCPGAHCQFAFYGGESGYHRALLGLQIFNAFMFFWLANFVLALGQVTLAGAFASYYWALHKPDDLPAFPLFSAFGRALRYHTGSLAFGALILAIVQIIRVMLEYLDQRLKGKAHQWLALFLMTCLKCCFWCLEKFIRFLNRNAYIMIASIYGTNFCTSARNAFFLLMRNIIRVAVLDKVTDFLFLLGKLLIVGSVGILAFFFFTHRIRIVQDTAPTLVSFNYLHWVVTSYWYWTLFWGGLGGGGSRAEGGGGVGVFPPGVSFFLSIT